MQVWYRGNHFSTKPLCVVGQESCQVQMHIQLNSQSIPLCRNNNLYAAGMMDG